MQDDGKPGPKRKPRWKAAPATLRCPSHLPEHGKQLWRKIVPQLEAGGGVSELDRPSLEAICLNYAHMREAAETIAREGLLVRGAKGNTVRHPAVMIFQASAGALKSWCSEFGLSVGARSLLPGQETAATDDLSDIFAQIDEP